MSGVNRFKTKSSFATYTLVTDRYCHKNGKHALGPTGSINVGFWKNLNNINFERDNFQKIKTNFNEALALLVSMVHVVTVLVSFPQHKILELLSILIVSSCCHQKCTVYKSSSTSCWSQQRIFIILRYRFHGVQFCSLMTYQHCTVLSRPIAEQRYH
jgi:hypothetical protein